MAQLDVFDTTLQKTSDWLHRIMDVLGWDQPQRAYMALRAVMHALRDRLPVIEATHLGAQLPLLIRGIYYEGWTPVGKPVKMHREDFLSRVAEHFGNEPEIDPLPITRAVFDVLVAKLDQGEVSKILGILPAEYADFWPVGVMS